MVTPSVQAPGSVHLIAHWKEMPVPMNTEYSVLIANNICVDGWRSHSVRYENKGAEVAVLVSKLFHPDHWRILMKFRTTPVYVFMV